MCNIDANGLARALERQHGIGLAGVAPVLGGQPFVGVRPTDLEGASGFQILIARSPLKLSATFVADTFAGRLIREMSQADPMQRRLFRSLVEASLAKGIRVAVDIDSTSLPHPGDLPAGRWQSLGLEVQRVVPRTIADSVSVQLLAIDTASLALDLALCLMDLESTAQGHDAYREGAKVTSLSTRYERNAKARARCIAHHGRACTVCGFDFGAFYGSVGENFIEVHHIVPISSNDGEYEIDPLNDLVPVCSNCHQMLHKQSPPIAVDELRKTLEGAVAESRAFYDASGSGSHRSL